MYYALLSQNSQTGARVQVLHFSATNPEDALTYLANLPVGVGTLLQDWGVVYDHRAPMNEVINEPDTTGSDKCGNDAVVYDLTYQSGGHRDTPTDGRYLSGESPATVSDVGGSTTGDTEYTGHYDHGDGDDARPLDDSIRRSDE